MRRYGMYSIRNKLRKISMNIFSASALSQNKQPANHFYSAVNGHEGS